MSNLPRAATTADFANFLLACALPRPDESGSGMADGLTRPASGARAPDIARVPSSNRGRSSLGRGCARIGGNSVYTIFIQHPGLVPLPQNQPAAPAPATANGNANICLCQCRCIIYAISSHSHKLSFVLEFLYFF